MGQEDAAPGAPATAPTDEKKTKHLVLDTGALIKGQGYRLAAKAERFWTIPEVIAEVRDPKSRCVGGICGFVGLRRAVGFWVGGSID